MFACACLMHCGTCVKSNSEAVTIWECLGTAVITVAARCWCTIAGDLVVELGLFEYLSVLTAEPLFGLYNSRNP